MFMDADDEKWYKYVKNGNYQKYINLRNEYNMSAMDSDIEITPEKKTKFNNAAHNLNEYWKYINPNYQISDYNQDYSLNPDYQQMLSDIEFMAERGA